MSYSTVFVGLACFVKQADGSRLVMLPDGRHPGGHIEPHFAHIAIKNDDIVDKSGWRGGAPDSTLPVTRFPIKTDSVVSISGLNGAGAPDLTFPDQGATFPKLPGFHIVPEKAETIARFPIAHGRLEARRFAQTAIVGLVTVEDHAGNVTITATPKKGKPRKLVVKDGTQIAVLNVSNSGTEPLVEEDRHFHIYSKLDVNRTPLNSLETSPTAPPLNSNHPLLKSLDGTFPGADCSVSGCCP